MCWRLFVSLHRLECAGETLRHTKSVLAEVAPDWLLAQITPEWFERYSRRFDEYRFPKAQTHRLEVAETMGADGSQILTAVYESSAPAWLRELPAVEPLRRVWVQQFFVEEGRCRWRSNENIPPPALMSASPYDLDARLGVKRNHGWLGYKVHLTEPCDDDQPPLIVHTETRCRDHPGLGHGRTDSLRLRARGLPSQQTRGGWGLCGCRCERSER
jgi:transposase